MPVKPQRRAQHPQAREHGDANITILDIPEFLRSIYPSQEGLLPDFLEAGVTSYGYLLALARSYDLRYAFLTKLRSEGKITFIQFVLIDKEIQQLRLDI